MVSKMFFVLSLKFSNQLLTAEKGDYDSALG